MTYPRRFPVQALADMIPIMLTDLAGYATDIHHIRSDVDEVHRAFDALRAVGKSIGLYESELLVWVAP